MFQQWVAPNTDCPFFSQLWKRDCTSIYLKVTPCYLMTLNSSSCVHITASSIYVTSGCKLCSRYWSSDRTSSVCSGMACHCHRDSLSWAQSRNWVCIWRWRSFLWWSFRYRRQLHQGISGVWGECWNILSQYFVGLKGVTSSKSSQHTGSSAVKQHLAATIRHSPEYYMSDQTN